MSEELEERKEEMKRASLQIPFEGTGLTSTLAQEFNRTVLPSWGLMIFLESGIVSFLLGLTFLLDAPIILIVGGLLQAIPTGLVILRRINGVKKTGSRGG